MKIAFRLVPFTDAQRDVLTAMVRDGGYEPVWYPDDAVPTVEELADCAALLGYFSPAMLSSLPRLHWVQTPAAGVERLCAAEWANPDAVLTNGSGAFGVAIAEYMLTGLLMQLRLMPAYMRNQQSHVWRCMGQCRSIAGSRITVVGMGDIGTAFAQRAKALGAHITGVRRTEAPLPPEYNAVYTADQLEAAVRDADAVVLALPGTAATKELISVRVLAAMRRDAILINCGRGATVDETALIEALQQGRLAGAVLDVMAVEPLPQDSPLWDMENVIITPHISGHDEDPINAARIYDIFRENLRRFLAGESLINVVNRQLGY